MWKKVLLIGLSILIIPYAIVTRIPIKYAIKIEDISKYTNSIIVKETWHTGTGWEKLGNYSGYFPQDEIEDVHLIGDVPPTTYVGGKHVNTYLCIVNSSDTFTIPGTTESFVQFEVLEWYPIYPVKRDTVLPEFIYPKNYLSLYDNLITR